MTGSFIAGSLKHISRPSSILNPLSLPPLLPRDPPLHLSWGVTIWHSIGDQQKFIPPFFIPSSMRKWLFIIDTHTHTHTICKGRGISERVQVHTVGCVMKRLITTERIPTERCLFNQLKRAKCAHYSRVTFLLALLTQLHQSSHRCVLSV